MRAKVLNPFRGKMIYKDGKTWQAVQQRLEMEKKNVPNDVWRLIQSKADPNTQKKLRETSKVFYDDKEIPRSGTHNSKLLHELLKMEGAKELILYSKRYRIRFLKKSDDSLTITYVRDQADVPKVMGKDGNFDGSKTVFDVVKGVRDQKVLWEVLSQLAETGLKYNYDHDVKKPEKIQKSWIFV